MRTSSLTVNWSGQFGTGRRSLLATAAAEKMADTDNANITAKASLLISLASHAFSPSELIVHVTNYRCRFTERRLLHDQTNKNVKICTRLNSFKDGTRKMPAETHYTGTNSHCDVSIHSTSCGAGAPSLAGAVSEPTVSVATASGDETKIFRAHSIFSLSWFIVSG